MANEAKKARYGFSTYKNYLLSLSFLLDSLYPDFDTIKTQLKDIQANPNADVQRIRSLLFNSWSSETLLNLPRYLNEDFVKFSNHWSPVQSYYSVYLATRALIVARNIPANGDHTTTLKVFASNFIHAQKIFLPPWNFLASSNGALINFPNDGTNVSIVNAQENPLFYKKDMKRLQGSYGLFLKTTRERLLEERCDLWKKDHPTKSGMRKQLPKGKRKELDESMRNISFLDCLFRLRTRSNYRDVDIFILGANTYDSRIYLDALCNITKKSLYLIELYIAKSIGMEVFNNYVEAYRVSNNITFIKDHTCGITERFQ